MKLLLRLLARARGTANGISGGGVIWEPGTGKVKRSGSGE
jgi:hypothetical protein